MNPDALCPLEQPRGCGRCAAGTPASPLNSLPPALQPPAGGNPDSNTLISDFTTVICLDDYHRLDREVSSRGQAGAQAHPQLPGQAKVPALCR